MVRPFLTQRVSARFPLTLHVGDACACVLLQVHRGMLVRNGLSVVHLLSNIYRPETLMEDTVDRDLLLVSPTPACC